MTSKMEVLWSPNQEEDFATYSTELRTYAISDLQGEVAALSSQDLRLSSHRYGKLTGVLSSDIHCMPVHQCVAWRSDHTQQYFFAVGQSSGKVILTNMGLDQPAAPKLNQILSPKSGRNCTCLAWNPSDTHLLAVGLEKARNDSSLVVWDTTRALSEPTPVPDKRLPGLRLGMDQSATAASANEDSGRCFETGHGEATSSVAWLPGQTNCLVAGMGTRFLRIFDTRDHVAMQHPNVASSKAIHGLSVDPSSTYQLATYAEGGTIFMWDVRHFARPAFSFTRSGAISRLSWLPTREGCLSVVLSEAPYLHLIDIPSFSQSPITQADVAELYAEHLTSRIADRFPYFQSRNKPLPRLTGVAWHSKWENTGLIANAEGGVKELRVYDRMPVSWTAREQLVYGSSCELYTAAPEGFEVLEEDISTKMKERVRLGYGFDPANNVGILHDDHLLLEVWKWLQSHQELTQRGILAADKSKLRTLPGVYLVLEADRPLEVETATLSKRVSWSETEGVASSEVPPFPTYSSPERTRAILLCGWDFVAEGCSLDDYLKREEIEEQFERAAAIAVFQGKVRRSVASLRDGAGVASHAGNCRKASTLNLIAMALSGYTPQESRLWHETCAGIKAEISNPYLRGAFCFLCSAGGGRDAFRGVTGEKGISLQDRVAFACMYLDDSQLNSYIHQLTKDVIGSGQVNGLFLTGLTSDGLRLLTNYVDNSGDVQTACLVAGQVMPFAIRDKIVQGWFQGYRDLLDQWQMWSERALFDGERKKRDPTYKPPRQAFVMCGFCSKSISSDSLRTDRRSALQSSAGGRKATSCPNCRKPLPRCSLCLLNMAAIGTKPKETSGRTSSQFGLWFTWCQSCRHGGHAHHMAEWFSAHLECPVTGCSCRCFSLDQVEKTIN